MRELAVAIQNSNRNVTGFETLDAVKRAGFKNIFIQWYNDKRWDEQKQVDYAKKLGLNIIFAHLGYQNINKIWENSSKGDKEAERYKKDILECSKNGINLVVMHLTSGTVAPNYTEIGLNRIKDIISFAKSLNVRIAFENLKVKGTLEYILENIKDENVGICYDAGHCHVHFNDEFNFEPFRNRIFAVHLHDNDKSDDQHLLPFDGTIDWDNVMKKIAEYGYDGPITLELCYKKDYLKQSLQEFYDEGYKRATKLAKIIN
jgi:L-ribulose-5-phosphate 3-epimerase